ncbi:uncharacterized protein M437DRAFT_10442, partial [Aureobasidium melanogenum CBS 110374]
RKRAKLACAPCKSRKRRCDGQSPCTTCTEFEYDCYYEHHPRKKNGAMAQTTMVPSPQSPAAMLAASVDDVRPERNSIFDGPASHLQSIEANSGAAFTRSLGLRMDSMEAPRLHMFAWNLGLRDEPIKTSSFRGSIVDILSSQEMSELASVYFAEVHPVYGFVDRVSVESMITSRWTLDLRSEISDTILCGIGALGCLFSHKRSHLEAQLVHIARMMLEHSTNFPNQSVQHVIGWLLRVIYLRLTASPHATWMASCTLMHTIEATRLHLEPSIEFVLSHPIEVCDPELRRRLYTVAYLFNTWISYDNGRSRVDLHGASCSSPTADSSGCSTDFLDICQLSKFLGPAKIRDSSELEKALSRAYLLAPTHPMLKLVKCNIVLCIYRRLRAPGFAIPTRSLEQILSVIDMGLTTIEQMIQTKSPWWHVSNVPFQIVCTLLAMDTSKSVSRLQRSLRALHSVYQTYGTNVTEESYTTARVLVRLHRRQKQEDLAMLDECL